MKLKNRRHAKILEIINDNNIETQDELTLFLNAAGFKATQATVSRDIKELQLVKILTKENVYRYEQRDKASSGNNVLSAKSQAVIREGIMNVRVAQNIVVVKCYTGMAQAVCASIDTLDRTNIVGTLAGDDTIFIVATDNDTALEVVSEINSITAG